MDDDSRHQPCVGGWPVQPLLNGAGPCRERCCSGVEPEALSSSEGADLVGQNARTGRLSPL